MMHYKFVIFGERWDLYKQSYSDLRNTEEAIYIDDGIITKNILRRIHLSHRINSYIELPFKKIWNRFYFNNPFSKDDDLCFVFLGNWIRLDPKIKFVEYLRLLYPNAKFVCFLQDLYKYYRCSLNQFDIVLSFDHGDAENYGFIYHPLVFSEYNGLLLDIPESDVYFLGKAKDRFELIISVFECLKRNGLVLDFNIVDVPYNRQKYRDEIHYINKMTYNENLQHLIHSKCSLEIMQGGGEGFTQRTLEVLGLNKRLLTNNTKVKTAPFYNYDYISQFTDGEDIDLEFLNKIKKGGIIDYKYKDKISPLELLSFIEKELNKRYQCKKKY